MDVNKKFLFVNPAGANEDGSRTFPVSALVAMHMDDTDSLILSFKDAGSLDHTLVDITITDGLGQTVMREFVEAINFSKDAVIVLADNSDDSSVSANIDFGTAPSITEGNDVVSLAATDDGTGTGQIPVGASFVVVSAAGDANHIVTLPEPVVGTIIHIAEKNGATTGFELRTSNPATIGINAGTGANAESAIGGAITLVRCVCVSSTNWVATQFGADGTESALAAAAV